uniref:Uncharacterized protein n=1 Tax=Oryza sativa subsp. japonica TaxID=39947 RepID=Q6Z9V8_ORYSJ|nr:hypothetical protein [Oryza sativa Japonica Group]BAC99617.1 hypothetical protein [Oryza sativa Japonica Group]
MFYKSPSSPLAATAAPSPVRLHDSIQPRAAGPATAQRQQQNGRVCDTLTDMAAAARRRGAGESRAGGGESAEMKRRGADRRMDAGIGGICKKTD